MFCFAFARLMEEAVSATRAVIKSGHQILTKFIFSQRRLEHHLSELFSLTVKLYEHESVGLEQFSDFRLQRH